MPTYLDLSVARIQQYLGRTPQLRGRRGASALLGHDQLWSVIRPAVAAVANGARLNEEAGEVDGVVSLVLDSADPATVARAALARLREHLPAAELSAEWGDGDDYVSYRAAVKAWRLAGIGPGAGIGGTGATGGAGALVDLPPVAEVPALLLCRACRLDPAVDKVEVPVGETPVGGRPTDAASGRTGRADRTEKLDVCADCAVRFRTSRRSGPQKTVWDLLSGLLDDLAPSPEDAFPQDLEDLARAAGRRQTQIATIAVDGNGLGAVLEELAARGVRKSELVQKIDKATADALQMALFTFADDPRVAGYINARCGDDRGRSRGKGRLPIEPHVLGGDDVLVTVPAPLGWPFVREFLEHFTRAGQAAVEELLGEGRSLPGGLPKISASAGMVFSHFSEPIADLVDSVSGLLRTAKQAVAGSTASIMWLDITEEGRQVPGHRAPLLLTDLTDGRADGLDPALRALAALPGSRRAALARTASDAETSRAEALRTGVGQTVEPFLSNRFGMPLSDALVLARWYR